MGARQRLQKLRNLAHRVHCNRRRRKLAHRAHCNRKQRLLSCHARDTNVIAMARDSTLEKVAGPFCGGLDCDVSIATHALLILRVVSREFLRNCQQVLVARLCNRLQIRYIAGCSLKRTEANLIDFPHLDASADWRLRALVGLAWVAKRGDETTIASKTIPFRTWALACQQLKAMAKSGVNQLQDSVLQRLKCHYTDVQLITEKALDHRTRRVLLCVHHILAMWGPEPIRLATHYWRWNWAGKACSKPICSWVAVALHLSKKRDHRKRCASPQSSCLRKRDAQEHMYLCQTLNYVLESALSAAPAADAQQWCRQVEGRLQSEAGELYSNVDVRAWPTILSLAKLDHGVLQGRVLADQICYQLCTSGELHEWQAGLTAAAALIRDLHQAAYFEADKIREIFNDKVHFSARQRRKFLVDILSEAPRSLVEEVLKGIDEQDTDLAEAYDDPEMFFVRDLIRDLDVDIHCCPNAYFAMQRDWLKDRHVGVTTSKKLSPAQICDHIEGDPNHAELLKVAVKSLLSQNRKFEAAQMLARPLSDQTRVAETNKNDKQLSYLIGLYKDVQEPPDEFGPIEEDALVLGRRREELLYVDDVGDQMDRLEADLLNNGRPDTIGVWWTWRCLDPKLHLRPRAEFVAIASSTSLAIVDIRYLEQNGKNAEERGKDVLRRILIAEHLLKVTHDLDRRALSALQRALVMTDDFYDDKDPTLPGISPVIDVTMAVAFTRRVLPGAQSMTVLSKLTYDYLRLELCLAEALSNFERRPLRWSQLHYAFTLAWTPLTILRVLCAYNILQENHIMAMSLRLGFAGGDVPWDEAMRVTQLSHEIAGPNVVICSDGQLEQFDIPGEYAANLWADSEWVENDVPKPDYAFPLAESIRNKPHLGSLVVQPSAGLVAACRALQDQQAAQRELTDLYAAHGNRPKKY